MLSCLRALSYNVQSVRSHGRLHDILLFARSRQVHVLLLQGTCLPRGEQPLDSGTQLGYHVVSAGYGKQSNRKSGCMICLSKKVFARRHLRFIAFPGEPCLAGRALAIRTVQPQSDYMWVAGFFPSCANTGLTRLISTKTSAWLDKLLIRSPRRTLPCLGLNANARVGLLRDGRYLVPVGSPSIGPCGAALDDSNGTLPRSLLEDRGLVASNVYRVNTETFVSGSLLVNGVPVTSRIDYIALPRCLHRDGIEHAVVREDWGKALQLADTARPVDHRPLVVDLPIVTLSYAGEKPQVKLDRDLSVDCVLRARHGQPFFDRLASRLEETRCEHLVYFERGDTNSMYKLFLGDMSTAAEQVLATSRSTGHETRELSKRRVQLLEDRRGARLDMSCCATSSLSSFFRGWHIFSSLLRLPRMIRLASRAVFKRRIECCRLEILQAWRSRSPAKAWRASGSISCTSKGAHRQWGRMSLLLPPAVSSSWSMCPDPVAMVVGLLPLPQTLRTLPSVISGPTVLTGGKLCTMLVVTC